MPNAKVSEATAKELVRLSELYIDRTIRFALAADSRAMQLSGGLVASLTALVVTSIGFLLINGSFDRIHFATGTAMIVAAIFFVLALRHSLSPVAPWGFNVNGNGLDGWTSDEDLYGPISEALIGQARAYQNQIDENNAILKRNASNISIALKLMALAPVLAVSAGVVAYFSIDKFDKLLTAIQRLLTALQA